MVIAWHMGLLMSADLCVWAYLRDNRRIGKTNSWRIIQIIGPMKRQTQTSKATCAGLEPTEAGQSGEREGGREWRTVCNTNMDRVQVPVTSETLSTGNVNGAHTHTLWQLSRHRHRWTCTYTYSYSHTHYQYSGIHTMSCTFIHTDIHTYMYM